MNNFKEAVIAQHMERTFVPKETAEKRWDGLNLFLDLCCQTMEEQVTSEPIDELWHDALLFTEGYREHCLRNFGTIVEHRPATIPRQASGYLNTRKSAMDFYGKLSKDVWPNRERQRWSIGYVKK